MKKNTSIIALASILVAGIGYLVYTKNVNCHNCDYQNQTGNVSNAGVSGSVADKNKETNKMTEHSVYDFKVKDIDGSDVSLSDFKGKVLLFVNVASQCGYTPQYKGLQEVYAKYKDKGFVVLGFPCNQFGGQEPGSNSEIKQFCSLNYSVSFPLFDKIDVNGKNTHPLYAYLKANSKSLLGENVKWNFTKFLVGKDGKVIDRFGSMTEPMSISKEIELALAK